MISHPISQLYVKSLRQLMPNIIFVHSKTCPAAQPVKVCPGSSGTTSSVKKPNFKRAEESAPCRFGFLPDDWFLFFYSKTGVTGPYIFGIAFINYMLSKEKYVLEHEYYSGLSIALILYLATTKLGPGFAASLDKQVNEVQVDWEQGRQDEINMCKNNIKMAKEAQWRAEGQKILMDAKKECIAIQLEREYRERLMEVYHTVKGRMDYHIKRYKIERIIQQKVMVDWVLDNVYRSITPEYKKQSLQRAIQDLAAAATGRVK